MYLIKDMPESERPRERLEKFGASALSSYELIAILLHTGTTDLSAIEIAKNMIFEMKEASGLRDKTVEELAQFRGVGKAKAVTILAALELGKRALSENAEMIRISSPLDVFHLVKDDLSDLKQEVLVALYLDLKSQLIAKKQIFVGGLNQSLVHPREIFKYAVKYSAFSVILVHNHPSGDPEPSRQDLEVTEVLKEAGELMQIKVIDHVIVAKNRYLSINDYLKIKGGK
jgi:DNA repair protein RadC